MPPSNARRVSSYWYRTRSPICRRISDSRPAISSLPTARDAPSSPTARTPAPPSLPRHDAPPLVRTSAPCPLEHDPANQRQHAENERQGEHPPHQVLPSRNAARINWTTTVPTKAVTTLGLSRTAF